MLVVIGADVDPRLPGMRRLPAWDPWDTLERIPDLESALGVTIDFSSLPGHLVWWTIDGERILVDWHRAPGHPYRPSRDDYQRPGRPALDILELPIASFRAGATTMAKRSLWRFLHGKLSLAGVSARTMMMTQPWPEAPRRADVLAF